MNNQRKRPRNLLRGLYNTDSKAPTRRGLLSSEVTSIGRGTRRMGLLTLLCVIGIPSHVLGQDASSVVGVWYRASDLLPELRISAEPRREGAAAFSFVSGGRRRSPREGCAVPDMYEEQLLDQVAVVETRPAPTLVLRDSEPPHDGLPNEFRYALGDATLKPPSGLRKPTLVNERRCKLLQLYAETYMAMAVAMSRAIVRSSKPAIVDLPAKLPSGEGIEVEYPVGEGYNVKIGEYRVPPSNRFRLTYEGSRNRLFLRVEDLSLREWCQLDVREFSRLPKATCSPGATSP